MPFPALSIARHGACPYPRLRLALFACYALLIAIAAALHPLWSDEAAVWVAMRYAGLHDLLNYFSYTGHPPLWHLLVLPLARSGLPVQSMQALNVALSCLMAWLLLYRSPFRLWLCAMLLFSLGMAFQYSVVARGYMLMTDLMFLIACAYPSRLARPRRYALLLALLAATEAFALPCAGLLILFFAHDLRAQPRRAAALAIAAFGFCLAIASLLPWDGLENMQDPYKNRHVFWGYFQFQLGRAFVPDILRPYLPFAFGSPLYALPGYVLLTLVAFSVPRTRWLALHACWLATMYGLFTFVFRGQYWYTYLFITFSVWVLWLRLCASPSPAPRPWLAAALCLTLAISDAATVATYYNPLPYSPSKDLAAFIRAGGYASKPIISLACYSTDSLAAYLPETAFWIAGQNRLSHYYLFGKYHDQCLQGVNLLTPVMLEKTGDENALLLARPGEITLPQGISATPLYTATGMRESFALYQLHRAAP